MFNIGCLLIITGYLISWNVSVFTAFEEAEKKESEPVNTQRKSKERSTSNINLGMVNLLALSDHLESNVNPFETIIQLYGFSHSRVGHRVIAVTCY